MSGLLFVGCRTTADRDARGTGVRAFRVESDGAVAPAGHIESVNPSFLLTAPTPGVGYGPRVVHAVHGDCSDVSSYRWSADGFEQLAANDTAGRNPAHLAFDASGRFVLVANHSGGSVAVLPVRPDGALGPVRSSVDGLVGPHQVVIDPVTRRALIPDKGADAIHVLDIDSEGTARLRESVPVPAGAGPRHLVFGPARGLVHVLDELACTVTTLAWEAGRRPKVLGRISTLRPGTAPTEWRAAELARLGNGALLASNRSGAGDRTPGGPGNDDIVEFRVGSDGLPADPRWHDAGGIRPRHFVVSGEDPVRVWVANERSDSVVAHRIEKETGQWRRGPVIETGSPTCVLWCES